MRNIVLVGMPGAGKSTVGVVLAKVLGYHFLDSDLVIQEQEGRLLHEIIEQEGLEGFVKIENRINASIEVEKTVISTGGSAIYGEEAMQHFREIGTVVYLKLSYETVESRLGNLQKRGVVLKEHQTLQSLYEERCPLYEKYAHVTVDIEDLTVEESMRKIVEVV